MTRHQFKANRGAGRAEGEREGPKASEEGRKVPKRYGKGGRKTRITSNGGVSVTCNKFVKYSPKFTLKN